MTFTQTETARSFTQPTQAESQTIEPIIDPVLTQFHQILRSHALFNSSFFVLGVIQLALLALFFIFYLKSGFLAISLAALFFTISSYFILRLYFQAKKREQFAALKEQFIQLCKNILHYKQSVPEHHIAIANACSKLVNQLGSVERTLYPLPEWLAILRPSAEQCSIWLHWQDVHQMKELMLSYAVEEYIRLVKCAPTSLEVHAALANAYVTLSGLYVDPRQEENTWVNRILFNDLFLEQLRQKFRRTAERAIEEFKILLQFAPHDPWVYAQLAYSYHDLNMPLEEIRQYEAMLKLESENTDTLLKLGILYFQQGLNAQGLGIFGKLKELDRQRADHLISFYGSTATETL